MEPEQKTNGALVGLIIIIIILILGGIYLWKSGAKPEAPTTQETIPNEETGTEPGSSETGGVAVDETSSLESETNSVDLESLDSEI